MSTSGTPAQLAANRANAALSTGPRTTEGKEKSSRNAVTTALTGRTVLLSSEDRALYDRHLTAYLKRFTPEDEVECVLVQSIADSDWRLNRIPLLLALQAKGEDELADSHTDTDLEIRRAKTHLDAFLKYEKQIRNLQLQESRLHRRREKDLKELQAMQQERKIRRERELGEAAVLYAAAKAEDRSFDPAAFGFEFSIADIERHLQTQRTISAASHSPSLASTPAKARR